MVQKDHENKKKRLIFLVDDDMDDRNSFLDALKKVDDAIIAATFGNGRDMLHKLEQMDALPDMIFLDLFMPEMDGEKCLIAIRGNERFENISITIYSSIFDIHKIGRLFELGASRYLQKPTSYSVLVNALLRTIESVDQNPVGGHAIIHFS